MNSNTHIYSSSGSAPVKLCFGACIWRRVTTKNTDMRGRCVMVQDNHRKKKRDHPPNAWPEIIITKTKHHQI